MEIQTDSPAKKRVSFERAQSLDSPTFKAELKPTTFLENSNKKTELKEDQKFTFSSKLFLISSFKERRSLSKKPFEGNE